MKAGNITALIPQRNNSDRYSIFVEEEFLLGVDKKLVVEYDLREGKKLTEDLLDSLLKQENLQQAKEAAFNLLGYRQRSRQELKERLARKGFKTEVIQEVIRILTRLDYIDDSEFAQAWIQDRITRGFGPYRVRQQLKEKGVGPQVIEEEIEAAYDFETEYDLAIKLAQKKKSRYKNKKQREKRYKLKQVLKRKGFSFAVIDLVLADVLKEAD